MLYVSADERQSQYVSNNIPVLSLHQELALLVESQDLLGSASTRSLALGLASSSRESKLCPA
jgi:hypothetical protein